MTFSKKILIWLFILAHVILLYAMTVMVVFEDLSSLSVLISVIGLELVAAIVWYFKKAATENIEKIRANPDFLHGKE